MKGSGADRPSPEKMPQSPFHDLLEITSIDCSNGQSRVELLVGQRHLRNLGIIHGGVAASLLDTALGTAAHSKAPSGYYTVSVQLNCNFIRPAWEGEKLIATGQVDHSGEKTAVCRGEVRTAEGILVATGTATLMFLPHSEKAGGMIQRRPDTKRDE